MAAASQRVEVSVGGRSLSLSNLDKVLWPESGFTKGQLIDYYSRIAPVMVPHLERRPITLRRWPNGVGGQSFFEKNCPSHHPAWVEPVKMGDVSYCTLDEPAALVWVANLAAIELHPSLARAPDLDVPTAVVFDLDPGAPADIITCARVGFILKSALERLGLESWPKTSGSKGLQIYAPLNDGAGYDRVKPFAQAIAQLMERDHPDLVVSNMDKAIRKNKILIDWSQNTASKTTVSVYSVRALDRPSVSTPVTWDELDAALSSDDASQLRFSPADVLERVEKLGDLHAPVLERRQQLPV